MVIVDSGSPRKDRAVRTQRKMNKRKRATDFVEEIDT